MEKPSLFLAECDVVVIGGGATGMICAAALASQGLKTVLAEPRGSLWWEATWARQRIVLATSTQPTLNAFRDELSEAGGIRNGIVEPVIAQLVADRFCIQRGVRVLFHARPIGVKWQESGCLQVNVALKGRIGVLSARGCVDCSDNGFLIGMETDTVKPQPVNYVMWCLTFSNCRILDTRETSLFLGGNELLIRFRPGCWDDEVIVDIGYPAGCYGNHPVELAFTSDLEPLVIELRRMAPELKGGILAHVADAPWSFPMVSIRHNDEHLAVYGEHGRLIGAGCWLDEVREKISQATFWEQSNTAINLAMELGEIAAQKMLNNLNLQPND